MKITYIAFKLAHEKFPKMEIIKINRISIVLAIITGLYTAFELILMLTGKIGKFTIFGYINFLYFIIFLFVFIFFYFSNLRRVRRICDYLEIDITEYLNLIQQYKAQNW